MADSLSTGVVADLFSTPATPGSLAFKHPAYVVRWWWWEFNRVSYVGGREYYRPATLSVEYQFPIRTERTSTGQIASTNTGAAIYDVRSAWYRSLLFRHNREEEWEFENRRKRAYYYNFVAPTVNALVSHTLAKPALRISDPTVEGDEEDELSEFWSACDEDRTCSIGQAMRRALAWAQVYGIYWACVDVDAGGDGKPYVYWVSPLDVWDWQTDDAGEIQWLKQYVYTEQARADWRSEVKPRHLFRVWYTDRVETWERVGGMNDVMIDTRPHGLGRVPFVPLYSRRSSDDLFPDGTSLVGDLCKTANHVYNLCSLLSEIYYKQTFSQLVITGADADSLDKVQIGTSAFIAIGALGGGDVKYVSPSADQARVLAEGIGAAMELARQSVGVGRGRSESSKDAKSGAALELESDDKRSILADIAQEAQDFERRLADVVLSMLGQPRTPEAKPHISYPMEFNLEDFTREIADVISLRTLGIPPEAKAHLTSQLLARKLSGMSPDELEAILAEVREATEEPAGTPDVQQAPPKAPGMPPPRNAASEDPEKP